MKYDFDRIIERRRTGSLKWDYVEKLFGSSDLLPMWVADMDFQAPNPVREALLDTAEFGIFGYTVLKPSFYDAVTGWLERRHRWKVDPEWLVFSPGIVPAVSMLIRAFTAPGEKVVIQPPVYYPFSQAVRSNERSLVTNPLKLENGTYGMDFDDLEKKVKDPGTKLLILCSPHNPVGRVWKKEEIVKLGELCLKNDVLVISDEIHSDLVRKGYTHVPFASISTEFAERSVTCNAGSKTFNLAGLHTSYVIIPDRLLRKRFEAELKKNGILGPNAFGATALEAAYTKGGEWLDQVLEYIEANYQFLLDFISRRIPEIKVVELEATYLVWMDFRSLGLGAKELEKLMQKEGKIALDEGYIFGEGGEGFERINIACPRTLLEDGLKRIEQAVRSCC